MADEETLNGDLSDDEMAEMLDRDEELIGRNPAYELADALVGWSPGPGEYAEQPRGFGALSFENAAVWRWQTQNMDLVRQVDDIVQGLDAAGVDVSMFENAVPRWYAGTYAATVPFQSVDQNNGRRTCEKGDIDLLRAFGALIEARGSVDMTRGDYRELQAALGTVRELLDTDSADIPQDVRIYMYSLVLRAQSVLDMLEAAGPEAARRLMIELSGALMVRAEVDADTRPDRAGQFRALAVKVVTHFSLGLGGEAAKQLGSGVKKAVAAAIESGAGG